MRGVEKRTENVKTDQDPSGWRPYHVFLESLREKYAKNESLQGNIVLPSLFLFLFWWGLFNGKMCYPGVAKNHMLLS